MPKGYLALILHAHLPYVRHPEYPEFLEEDWLFEAIAETYVPLLQRLEQLVLDGVSFKIAFTLSPTLCAMLRDPLLQDRAERYYNRAVELCRREIERNRDHPELESLARFYHDRFSSGRSYYVERCGKNLIGRFAAFQELGVVEIITCAASHGFLPLMEQFPEAVRAQIFIARDYHRECFGRDPSGIWLPECAYVSGIEATLQEANLRWFIIDAHGLMFGTPRPVCAIYSPVFTPSGVATFARDRDSSRQVWSSEEGYPGDPAYRDFYRDIGFDLPMEALRDFMPEGGVRKFTGIKYHRITGRSGGKELYHRGWALGAADHHAWHFMNSRQEQIRNLQANLPIDPIVVSPFDAELFGHWWFEGPEFLDWVIRKSVYDQSDFELTTPSAYLSGHSTLQMLLPSASSWGHKGYWEVWLDESNSWIYPHLHVAARRMSELARLHLATDQPLVERTLAQMARELLLAQSSDWAFLMKTGTAREYATKRTKDHILRFTRLYDQLRCMDVDESFLKHCEWRDNLFPQLEWRYYA
jgi:1,4-alpha-glucan branching enzyme